jgi:endonuclease-3
MTGKKIKEKKVRPLTRAGEKTLSSGEGDFKPRPLREIARITAYLAETYPEARCGLDFENAYQLLTATILSAQCTDQMVNRATPELFRLFPDPQALAAAEAEEVEQCVKSCGFFRQKAKSIIDCARTITEKFGGQVPGTLEELVTLKGVGRKTANVVLGNVFGIPGLTVDTHVKRISLRLELTASQIPERIESDLMVQIPQKDWTEFSHRVIAHGRTLCLARKPLCGLCTLSLCRART